MSDAAIEPRPRCVRCWRPPGLCYCRALEPVATRTRVVFLQHPRERAMKMGTARMAHLGLANSELHVGVRFDEHPRVRALVADPARRVALLYPGGDGTPVDAVTAPPETLVVIDGTWITARKMIARSPLLARLPRLTLAPPAPSAYRIRREPAPHCLSTLEAVVAALGALEGTSARMAPLLAAFEALVATQLRYAGGTPTPYRHERRWRRPRRPSAVATLLAARRADIVLAQAEGNPLHDGGPHELVHLVAARPASGERFATIVMPRRPLGARTPERLGLGEGVLRDGAAFAEALAAWARFLRPTDLLAGWGDFTPRVLEAEAVPAPPWIDLRGEVARRIGRGARGVEEAAACLGSPMTVTGPSRGERRLAALEALLDGLMPGA